MKRVLFVCQWGRDKEKAWSGTYYSLYRSLSKYLLLDNLEIKTRLITLIKNHLYGKVGLIKYDFMYSDIRKFIQKQKLKAIKGEVCVLQFAETDLPDNIHGYIYQDMCVQYIKDRILSNPALSPYFRKNVSEKILRIRCVQQKKYYEKCKGIFVMGEWLKDYLIKDLCIDEKKVHCVGAGYDIDVDKVEVMERTSNKILFVGRDFERKGGFLLLRAFSILKNTYIPDAELYIVGPTKLPPQVLGEGVVFVGEATKKELIELYSICDIFCMPSYLEPYGKAYAEALCCGLPVIARNSFSAGEFVVNGMNGVLVDSDDAEELASVMFKVLNSFEMKEYVKQNMSYYRAIFSWDNVAKKISKVIEQDEYFKR